MRRVMTLAAVAGLTLGGPIVLDGGALRAAAGDDKLVHIYSQFRGADVELDVVSAGPLENFVHLVPKADVSGQNWIMVPDAEGTFRLTTQFRGKDMCLDVVRVKGGGGPDGFLKLTPCGNHEGQYWTSQEDGGWLKLRPQFWKLCLDVVNGGQLDGFVRMVECADYSGQHWKIE